MDHPNTTNMEASNYLRIEREVLQVEHTSSWEISDYTTTELGGGGGGEDLCHILTNCVAPRGERKC